MMDSYAEVRRPGLSPEDERFLWENYDNRARARIIEAYQPLVFHIYGKLGLYLGEEAVDVISEGTVGLIHAVDNFDYRRGVPFKSYAYLRVKGSMRSAIRGVPRLCSASSWRAASLIAMSSAGAARPMIRASSSGS